MSGALVATIVALCLALAAWSGITVLRDRKVGLSHLAWLGLVEIVVLVQAVIAIARLIGGHHTSSAATFVGYVIGTLLVPPIAGLWGLAERTRWGPAVVAVGALTMTVLMLRWQQVWRPNGA
jgi:hypothetical protein